jgi:hypothetical protein
MSPERPGNLSFMGLTVRRSGWLSVVALLVVVAAGCASSRSAAKQGGSVSVIVESGPAQPNPTLPKNRLIVPGVSIAGIRFREPRKAVTKTLGAGRRIRRDYVSYLNGRLRIVYSFHDRYTGRVQGLITRWSGFRTRSGVHVGSPRHALGSLHVACSGGYCSRGTSRFPDGAGIILTMHHGRVAEIFVGST